MNKKIILAIIGAFIATFLLSSDTFAISLSTSSFDWYYMPQPNTSYRWRNGILYGSYNNGQQTATYSGLKYQFTTGDITPTGNYATMHFETNIVGAIGAGIALPFNWVNRNQIVVTACSSSAGGAKVESSNVSTVVTNWSNNNINASTLTVYGDVTISGITPNTTQQIVCAIGSNSYNFFQQTNLANVPVVYFERNVGNILFSSNIDDALLKQQNALQQQAIATQEQIRDGVGQTTDAVNNLRQTTQNLNNSITDSNISGSFDVQPVPAFGPVANLLNNILELPRILLNIDSCHPIVATLPFVNEDINIPCMSSVFSQAYPTFILFLDTITSAYIWFRVARYIVRQVQHLRDPEQEDEEYLDI